MADPFGRASASTGGHARERATAADHGVVQRRETPRGEAARRLGAEVETLAELLESLTPEQWAQRIRDYEDGGER